jgi:hypothetical protein
MLPHEMPLLSLVTRTEIGKQDGGLVTMSVRTVSEIPNRKATDK